MSPDLKESWEQGFIVCIYVDAGCLVSDMPIAVYFLGDQSGSPKGQVQLNILICFLLPTPHWSA